MLLITVVSFLIIPNLVISYNIGTYDYCDPNLCPAGKTHIACNNSETFSPECGENYFLVPMNNRMKNLILHLHNARRNDIALGKIEPYPGAQRMPVMKWDNEFEQLATLNVKRCRLAHDECRNTKNFKYVGQNTGIVRTREDRYEKFPVSVKKIINAWFTEHKNGNQTFIESYRPHPIKGKKIGHFTAMISDKAVKMGCACILFTNKAAKRNCFLMTCNYSSTNFLDQPVYTPGNATSGCKEGKSKHFDGMCPIKESLHRDPETGLLD